MNVKELIRSELIDLKPYEVEDDIQQVKLDANERPLNIPDSIRSEIAEKVKTVTFNRYPDAKALKLRNMIANDLGVISSNILIGNGSSELLELLCYTFGGEKRTILYPNPSFSMYGVYTKLSGSQSAVVDLDQDYQLPIELLLGKMASAKPNLVILCNPNNPTGTTMPLSDIEKVLAKADCPVIVDEAYYEFYGQSALRFLSQYKNLIIVRTFSKAYGLAGIRVGYMIADEKIVSAVEKATLPYHMNALSLLTAEAVYRHREEFQTDILNIIAERERLTEELKKFENKLFIYKSQTNFLLVRVGSEGSYQAKALVAYLNKKGIAVRDFSQKQELTGCIRISIGTQEENNLFLTAVRQFLDSEGDSFGA